MILALFALMLGAQTPERMVGTISTIQLDKATIEIKGQDGTPVSVHLTNDTILQRVAPGEKSLKNAETIQVTNMAVGDKVLVNNDPTSGMARRVVVMSATAITKHDEADRSEWTTHGISGIVAAKTGDDITLRKRTMQGETQEHVLVSKDTSYRKYAQDSVRFADAKASSFTDIQVGDQLRAKGDKSEDGTKVTASEVVFGTFVTKAGTITAIDPATKSVAVRELNTNTPFNIRLTADSQLKQMPNFAMPAGGPPPMIAGGKPPDMAQMIEHMPSVGLDGLKVGDTIVMSSTQGKVANEYTAIVLLDNAEMLIKMAGGGAQQTKAGGVRPQQGGGGMQGMSAGGLGGLELPGMMQ